MRFFSNTTLENQVCRPKSGINLYPFGSPMPGRNFNSTSYRFGFNGKENDNEVSGSGNHLDFGDRGYDPRRGQWWSVDWKSSKYPHVSPYAFALDNPIFFVDEDGNDIGVNVTKVSDSKGHLTIDAVITVRMKVVNMSSKAMSKTEMKSYTDDIKASAGGQFSGSGYYEGNVPTKDGKYHKGTINYNITVKVELEEVSSLDKLGKDDHVLLIVNDIPPSLDEKGKMVDPIGLTANGDQNGRIMAVETKAFESKNELGVAVHELGHSLGLGHAASVNNLMYPSVQGTYGVSGEQRGDIATSQGINQNAKVGTTNHKYKTSAKDDANSFIKNNKINVTNKQPATKIKD